MFHVLIGKISLLAYSLELLAPRESFGIKACKQLLLFIFLGIGNVEYYMNKTIKTMVGFMKNAMGFIKP
jgi:hypothetical protein